MQWQQQRESCAFATGRMGRSISVHGIACAQCSAGDEVGVDPPASDNSVGRRGLSIGDRDQCAVREVRNCGEGATMRGTVSSDPQKARTAGMISKHLADRVVGDVGDSAGVEHRLPAGVHRA